MATSKIAHFCSYSSFGSSAWIYEVFLSFCGKDTRTNFTDVLHSSLVTAGILTFRDDDELHTGDQLSSKLFAAIQQSKISIPIFSRNYASSKWCLKELTEICKCRTKGQIVLPIFYDVEPSEVRYQTGSYAEAFEKHRRRVDETTVQVWKEALTEIADLKGWNVKDWPIGKLSSLVVAEVSRTLNRTPMSVPKNLVGIQSHTEKILNSLCIGSEDRKILGIHGLGGIGKTTIAKVVFNTIFNQFDGWCFVANVRETAQQCNGLVGLQKQLLFGVLKQENFTITDVDDGIDLIKRRLCQKKALLVLDDVDQVIQLKALAGDSKWFGRGSRIIITSRNKEIILFGTDEIYEPNVMDLDQSLQLFSYHAFKSDQPPKDYLDLSKAMVKTTGGLPLALEFLGSSLYSKEKPKWQMTLENLPQSEIFERLRISYDGLKYEEQQMFLDVACFFNGMSKDIACYIWEGCNSHPQRGLDILCLRSLVKIGENGELMMHDLLQELGREIVRDENMSEPEQRSRIWCEGEVLDVLRKQMGTRKIKGLSIDFRHESRSQWLHGEGFNEMTELRLLHVNYVDFFGNLENPFSELRWLSWRRFPKQLKLTNFRPMKLVVLDLSCSEITEDWMVWDHIKMAANLKVLHLESCQELSRSPRLSENKSLEVLILKDCKRLKKIDPSISHLTRLVILDVNGCVSLMELPDEICHLRSLQRLDLRGCKDLKILPKKLGCMEALKEFRIDRTSVQQLPDSIGDLKYLETFSTSFCSISEGGGCIGRLSSWEKLTTLDLSGCEFESLPNLPSSLKSFEASNCRSMTLCPMLSNLTNLEALSLGGCVHLKIAISDSENLSKLKALQLFHNPFSCLPPIIDALTSLKELCLERCLELENVSNLPHSLKLLCLVECLNLRRVHLPSSLTSLNIEDCTSIEHISDLPKTLICLHATGCKLITKLSATEGLRDLETLCLDGCQSLEKIEGNVERLDSLEVLMIMGNCRLVLLKEILKLSDWKKLREVKLGGDDVSDFEGLERMYSVEKLNIENSPSLRKIPKLSDLKKLRMMEINGCKELSEIEGLEDLESLEELQLRDCDSFIRLPAGSLSNLKKLERFVFSPSMASKIEYFEGLESLANLRHLEISGCISMERVPDLSNLIELRKLKISCCVKLKEIPGLDRLESLRSLNLCKCLSIEMLPDLSSLTYLKELMLEGCNKLTEIQGVDRLEFLEKLMILECKSLKSLPDLSHLKYLKHRNTPTCRNGGSGKHHHTILNHLENHLPEVQFKHHISNGIRRVCDFSRRHLGN